MNICPLCCSTGPFHKREDAIKRFLFTCSSCKLVFAGREFLLSPEKEKDRYLDHQNSTANEQYMSYLASLTEPLLKFIPPGAKGLDFGCGPVMALSEILSQKGIECMSYDPFFFPILPEATFDFIFAVETVEHFHEPFKEFKKLINLLSGNGLLFIITSVWNLNTDFKTWYYSRDNTHVSFYNEQTFLWLAGKMNLKMKFSDNLKTVVFQKQ
jgi:SAM-dependent methyltransferase